MITESNEASNSEECKKIYNPCEICLKTMFKYKCPRCGLKTCSLECCKKHKVDTGCSGQRDKTKFVSKEKFDENLLINDYRFLEEQSRVIDAYQRAAELGEEHILNGKTLAQDDTNKSTFSYGFYENLRKFVHKQFNINLKLMPVQSTRHLNNRSRYNRSLNMVSWSIEFVFHLDSIDLSTNQKYLRIDSKKYLFSSKDKLATVLNNFYSKFKLEYFDKSNLKYLEKKHDEIKLKKLSLLIEQFSNELESENWNELNILYEINDFKEKKKYFLKFDFNKTLEELLTNRTMIEYPSLYLVKNKNLNEYEVIEEEKEKELAISQEYIEQVDVPTTSNQQDNQLEDEENDDPETESSESEVENECKKLKIDQNYDQDDELEEGEERD